MKLGMKGVHSIAACLILVISLTSVIVATGIKGRNASEIESNNTLTSNGIAGVVANGLPEGKLVACVESINEKTVSISGNEDLEYVKKATKKEKKKSFFDDKMICNVTNSLNVRKEPSKEADIVGKMFKGDLATVVEEKDGWLKIESGDVQGYIMVDFAILKKDAEKYAKKNGFYKVVIDTDCLRIREKGTTNGKILDVASKGATYPLSFKADEYEGFYAIKYEDDYAYVSAEYSHVELTYTEALTMKQYEEKLKKEEEARIAKEKAEAEAKAKAEAEKKKNEEILADTDEETLLAALIMCEAGNQSYEGKLAVGAVVCNRIRSSSFPNTLRGVIYQRGQFGPAGSGLLAERLENKNINDGCYRAARAALSGEDNTGGKLYFNNKRCGHQGLIIGDHVFW